MGKSEFSQRRRNQENYTLSELGDDKFNKFQFRIYL